MIVHRKTARFDTPLPLECGKFLPEFELAYESYGKLNNKRDNAILICHGLTATQNAAGIPKGENGKAGNEKEAKPGWWDTAIGPGKPIDTKRFYVICANVLGSFGGSTSPASINPETGKPYGMAFPVVTITDMVDAQKHLADRLGIEKFHTIAGGCMGGFQVLAWMSRYPGCLSRAVVISTTPRVSAHTIALWSVLREAIRSDPAWNGGDYYGGSTPDKGMGLAAAFGALFWMNRQTMDRKFGLKPLDHREPAYGLEPEFEVEAFLSQVNKNAAGKIDANALIYLTRAMDYFNMTRGGAELASLFAGARYRALLVSYKSDWRYPPQEAEEIHEALKAADIDSHHEILESHFGHGAFIYDFEGLGPVLKEFLHSPAHSKPSSPKTSAGKK